MIFQNTEIVYKGIQQMPCIRQRWACRR